MAVEAGRLRGVETRGGLQFLGVPYAEAPRFAPPAPIKPWTGVHEARTPGPAAPQPDRAVARFTHGDPPATDERECLNLNVFTPSPTGRRPVLVWLHGGGFAVGHAGATLYHGAHLAGAADVVVVTVNYRLGSLGWLFHPDLAAVRGAPAGNWGLLDQIAALRWVRENILAFGGDPARVTLAGQSAGALCAMDLLVAPAARGLFGRAIVQSPPIGDVAGRPEPARGWAEALSELAGAPSGFDAALLRSLPAETIVALHEHLLEAPGYRGTRGAALPTVDAGSLPRSPVADPGASGTVDVLIGSTDDEGTFFVDSPWRPPPSPEQVDAVVRHLTGTDDPAAVIDRYRAVALRQGRRDEPVALLVKIATDAIVARPTSEWVAARADAVTGAGGRVYRYRVDHRGAVAAMGATHTVEVPLLFGTWDDGGPGQRLGGHGLGTEEVAREIVTAWARFVHGDDPGWPAIGAGTADREVGVFGGERPFSVEHQEGGPDLDESSLTRGAAS